MASLRSDVLTSVFTIGSAIAIFLEGRKGPHGRVVRVGNETVVETVVRLNGRQHVQGFGSAEGCRTKQRRRRRRRLRLVFQVPFHLVTRLQTQKERGHNKDNVRQSNFRNRYLTPEVKPIDDRNSTTGYNTNTTLTPPPSPFKQRRVGSTHIHTHVDRQTDTHTQTRGTGC